MFGYKKKDRNIQKEGKVPFLKALPQISLFKSIDKRCEASNKKGKNETFFTFSKKNGKKQLEADWKNTCEEMNKRAESLQVK